MNDHVSSEPTAPSVCCVLLNWNGWRDTIACLESLQKSTYPRLSVLLVDNGSTDNSIYFIREAHPWVDILETHANLGFAGGNNHGIRLALSRNVKYIWLLNNDTIIYGHTLGDMVAAAEENPLLGEIGSVLYYADQPDKVQAWGGGSIGLWTGVSRHYFEPVPPEKLDYLSGASVLIPSRIFHEVGLLDEKYFMYWEDTDFSYRVRAAGWKLGVANSATLLHRESASSGLKSPTLDRYVSASGIRFFLKFAPLPCIPIFFLVICRAAKRFVLFEWRRGWAILSGLRGSGKI
jgi:GT2 family glycosyltransferase